MIPNGLIVRVDPACTIVDDGPVPLPVPVAFDGVVDEGVAEAPIAAALLVADPVELPDEEVVDSPSLEDAASVLLAALVKVVLDVSLDPVVEGALVAEEFVRVDAVLDAVLDGVRMISLSDVPLAWSVVVNDAVEDTSEAGETGVAVDGPVGSMLSQYVRYCANWLSMYDRSVANVGSALLAMQS